MQQTTAHPSAAVPAADVRHGAVIRTLSWRLRVFYDAQCPICDSEIGWLRSRTRPGEVLYQDINDPAFDPHLLGLTRETLMRRLHGQLPGGRLVTGMEVFRQLYRAAGLGWVMAPTCWPLLRSLADRAYELFARNRLRWTGRADCDVGCRIDRRVSPSTFRQLNGRGAWTEPAGGHPS